MTDERRFTVVALLVLLVLPLLVLSEALLPGNVLASAGTAYKLPWLSTATEAELALPRVNADTIRENLVYRVHLHETLGQGQVPWWTPSMFGGLPFVALNHTQALYPVSWLISPLDPYLAFGLVNALHMVLAGLGAFWWLRAEGRSVPAALLGGIAFQLNGMFATRHGHPQFVATGAWLPFALLGISWLFTRRRRWGFVAIAAATAMMVLAGHPSVYVYGTWFVGAFLALRLFVFDRLDWRERGRVAGTFALAFLCGLALTSFQVFAVLELREFSSRGTQSVKTLTHALSHWGHLFRMVFPEVSGSEIDRNYWSVSRTSFTAGMLYMGVAPLILAAIGGTRTDRRGRAMTLLAIAVLCLEFVGPVFQAAYHVLPGFQFSRVDRLSIAWYLALTWLAAYGLDAVRTAGVAERRRPPWPEPAVAYGVLGLLIAVAALVVMPILAAVDETRRFDPEHLRAQVAWGAVLWALSCGWLAAMARRPGARWLVPALLVLVALDLGSFARENVVVRRADRIFRSTPAIAYLQAQEGPFRILKLGGRNDIGLYTVLPANIPMVYGIEDIHGFAPMHMAHLDTLTRAVERGWGRNPWHLRPLHDQQSLASPTIDLLQARFLLTDEVVEAPGFVKVHGGDLEIYENTEVLPRALFVPEHEVVQGPEAARRIASGAVDPRRTVLLQDAPPPGLDGGGEGEVRILEREATSMVLEKTGPGAGWVLVLDPWYPGWRATVDGEEVGVRRADVTFRAVPVSAGRHEVRLFYRPAWFTWAGLLTALGGAVLLAAVTLAWRRPSP